MVDLATRRGNKCSSPSKRARDGPRSAAHDSAAAIAAAATSTGAAAVSVSRRPSMPSFNLQTATSAPTSSTSAVGRSSSGPPPKRGNTVAHAGGHRVSRLRPFVVLMQLKRRKCVLLCHALSGSEASVGRPRSGKG